MFTEIGLETLGAIGGVGVIVAGLAGWLGKVWAGRIVEAEKKGYLIELESLKAALALSNASQIRNSTARFESCTQLWAYLQDLNLIGARLWNRATEDGVVAFANALNSAKMAAARGRIILSEQHYSRLQEIFTLFDNYYIGKKRLVDIRTREEISENFNVCSEDYINRQIQDNRSNKVQYEALLEEILHEFRSQLGLMSNQAL